MAEARQDLRHSAVSVRFATSATALSNFSCRGIKLARIEKGSAIIATAHDFPPLFVVMLYSDSGREQVPQPNFMPALAFSSSLIT